MDGSGESESGDGVKALEEPELMEPPESLGEKVVVYFSHNAGQLVRDVVFYSAWVLLTTGLFRVGVLFPETYYLLLLFGIVVYAFFSPGWEIPWHDEASLYASVTDADEDEVREALDFDREEEGWRRIQRDDEADDDDDESEDGDSDDEPAWKRVD